MGQITIGRCNGLTIDHNVYRKSNVAGISGVWLQGQAFNCRVGDGEVFRNVSGTPTFEVKDEGAGNMCPGYGLRMIRGSTYGVASGSLRIIPFDVLSEVMGNPGDSLADGVFTVPSDGVWQFSAGVQLDTGSTGSVTLNLQLNATSGNSLVGTSGSFPSNYLCVLSVTAPPRRYKRGDQIRVGVLTGTNRTVQASSSSFFDARRLS